MDLKRLNFKELSNEDLCYILESDTSLSQDQKELIKQEIKRRNLTLDQLEQIREAVNLRLQSELEKDELVNSIPEEETEEESEEKQTSNKIDNITYAVAGIILFTAYRNREFLLYVFTEPQQALADLYSVIWTTLLLILAVGAVLFWFRKKVGWGLVTIVVVQNLLLSLADTLEHLYGELSGEEVEHLNVFNSIYLIGIFLIYWGGLYWSLISPQVKQIYMVRAKTIVITLLIGLALFSLEYYYSIGSIR